MLIDLGCNGFMDLGQVLRSHKAQVVQLGKGAIQNAREPSIKVVD